MAKDPWSGFSGGSSSSGAWGDFGSGSSYLDDRRRRRKKREEQDAARKKSKRKDRGGFLGLVENLLSDVGSAVQGVVPGAIQTAGAVVRDAGELVGVGDGKFELDDIGKSIVDDYKYTYGPAFKGDWDTTKKRMYEHPLGPVLDALTIATLGAGAAVKGAKVTAGVETQAKLTGGKVRELASPEDAQLALDKLRVGQPRGSRKVGSVQGNKLLEPADRLLTTKAEKRAHGLSSALSPNAKRERVAGDKTFVKVGTYSENLLRRSQQRAWDAISEATKLADIRTARAARKQSRDAGNRKAQAVGANAAAKAARNIDDPKVARALYNQASVGVNIGEKITNEDVMLAASNRSSQLEADLARVADETDMPEREKRVVSSVVGRAKGDKAVDAVNTALGITTSRAAEARARKKAIDERDAGVEEYNAMVRELDQERAMQADDNVEQVDLAWVLENAVVESPDGKLVKIGEAMTDEQVQRSFDLADDIAEYGFEAPIDLVRRKDGRVEVINGVARLIAASKLERTAVPARLTVTHAGANRLGRGGKGAVTRDNRIGPGDRYGQSLLEYEPPSAWRIPVHMDEQVVPTQLYKTVAEARDALERRVERLERRRDILQRAAPDPEKFLDDVEQIVSMRNDPAAQAVAISTLEVQRDLASRGLDIAQLKDLNVLFEVMRPVVEEGTDRMLAEQAAMAGNAGPRDKADRGIAETGFAVPRTSNRNAPERAAKQSASNRNNPGPNMRRPDSAKFSQRYNDRFGLDAADPKNIVATFEAVKNYQITVDMWNTVLDKAIVLEDPLGEIPKGYKLLPQGQMNQWYTDMRAFVDDYAPVAFGDDNPIIEQLRETVVAGIGAKMSRGVMVVPEALEKAVRAEMKPRSSVPVLDQMTGLWRLSVVSPLRPAFLANNFLGQTALLLVANGSLKTLRGMVGLARHHKDLDRFTGGVVGSGQSAALMRENSHFLRSNNKIMANARNFNEFLGRISQALTDDPFRRIAFASEVMPTAEKILARNRGKMVDLPDGGQRPYMMKDALEDLLGDEEVISRVERKVMGDLVDFDDLGPWERAVVRRIMPFYGWIKGSSKLTIQMMLNDPAYFNLLTRIGLYGAEMVEKQAGGDLPEYMLGLMGLKAGKDGKDKAAFATAQFSPFVTAGDTLGQLGWAAGIRREGENPFNPNNPLAATSPLVKSFIAGFTGKDPFSGREMNAKQVFASSFPQIGSFAPEYRNIIPQGLAYRKDGIYGRSVRNELLKYFGVPVRENIDVEKAMSIEANPPNYVDGTTFVGRDGVTYVVIDGVTYRQLPKKKKE